MVFPVILAELVPDKVDEGLVTETDDVPFTVTWEDCSVALLVPSAFKVAPERLNALDAVTLTLALPCNVILPFDAIPRVPLADIVVFCDEVMEMVCALRLNVLHCIEIPVGV